MEKDFYLMHVNRKDVKDNKMPLLMFYMDRSDLSKSLRFNFVGEGAQDAGILDYGGGKKDFFQTGMKALFEEGTVFTKREGSSMYYLAKGVEEIKFKQAGHFLVLAVLNNVEVQLPVPVALLLKLVSGTWKKGSLSEGHVGLSEGYQPPCWKVPVDLPGGPHADERGGAGLQDDVHCLRRRKRSSPRRRRPRN